MYKLTNGATILRLADGASIPPDPKNADYRAYVAWVAAGNEPEPADPEPEPEPSRDERLLAAVEQAEADVDAAGLDAKTAAVLKGIVGRLGAAIAGGSP